MKDKQRHKKNNVAEELKEISPLLHTIKEDNTPFKVPENYFNQFQDQMLQRLNMNPEPASHSPIAWRIKSWLDQLGYLLQPRMALALSSVLILLIASWFLFSPEKGPSSGDLNFASLSIDEIQQYIDANLDDFDEETVKEVAQDGPNLQLIPSNAIDTEEIDQYFDDMMDQIDPSELEELL